MTKSMKKMLLMATIAVMVLSLAAAPAMAHNKAQDDQNDPSATGPVVHDHRDGSSNDKVEEEPLRDPGIRLCDIVPTECQNTEDSKDDHSHNSGARPMANDPNPVKEEASTPGAVKAGEVAGRITTTLAQENDTSAAPKVVSAPDEAGQMANSAPDIWLPLRL